MKRLTVALIAALGSPLVLALEKPYVGIDYQVGTFEINNTDVNPETVRLRVGSEIKPYLAVEAHAGFSSQSDTLTVPGVKYDIEVESYYALFVRPQISLGDHASLFALVGGSYMDVSANSNNPAFPSSDGFSDSFSYGAGVDVTVYKGVRIGADFIQYNDDYSAVSAGIRIPIR